MGTADVEAKNELRAGVRELRGKLTHYLRLAAEGTTILITSRDKVIAELKAPAPERLPPRRPGALKGRIWIADDFDVWPDDILETFERWPHDDQCHE